MTTPQHRWLLVLAYVGCFALVFDVAYVIEELFALEPLVAASLVARSQSR